MTTGTCDKCLRTDCKRQVYISHPFYGEVLVKIEGCKDKFSPRRDTVLSPLSPDKSESGRGKPEKEG